MRKPKPLKDRLTATLLKRLRERKLTNSQAAEQLGVSETYLSRTVAAIQQKVPGESMQAREAASKLAAARRQTRQDLAKLVKTGDLSLEKAAAKANCSVRTMQRHVAQYVESKRRPRSDKRADSRSGSCAR